MSAHPSLVTLAAVVITGFVLAGHITLAAGGAVAHDGPAEKSSSPSSTPVASKSSGSKAATHVLHVPRYKLNDKDEIAALERIQYALNEVGDGSVYVWRRWHGGLSGVIHPTTSFKDKNGKVCRHLMVLMTTGETTKRIESIACRLPSGRWQL